MKRYPASKRKTKKRFSKTAARVKSKNFGSYRGGVRL
jgi:hypothetical protein